MADIPYFSVCIPTYNRHRYLADMVDSMLAQEFGDWELVIVDNASSDDTPKALSALGKDGRIRIMRESEHVGMTENFNRCLAYCRGRNVMLLTDKDRLRRNALLRIRDFLEREKTDLTYFNYCAYDEQDRKIYDKRQSPFYFERERTWDPAEFTGLCRKNAMMVTTIGLNFVMPREFMEKHGLRFGDYYRNDVFLFLSALKAARRIGYIPEPLVAFRSISAYSYKREPDVLNRVKRDYVKLHEALGIRADERTLRDWTDAEDRMLTAGGFPGRTAAFLASMRFVLLDPRLLEVKISQAAFFVQKYVLAKARKRSGRDEIIG
ncbi:MAG: glycosyltransferase family 2 protein [Pseudomonadota bacterium]